MVNILRDPDVFHWSKEQWKNNFNELAYFIINGDTNSAINYIEKNKDKINQVDSTGSNILHFLSKYYNKIDLNLIVTKYIVRAGIDLNLQNNDGHTPLIYVLENAPYHSKYFDFIEIIKLLIENSADLNIKNKYGWTALMITILHFSTFNHFGLDIIKLLLQNGADPNLQNLYGYTALMLTSCLNDDPKITKILLDYVADVDLLNDENLSAFDLANGKNLELLHSFKIIKEKHQKIMSEICIQIKTEANHFLYTAECVRPILFCLKFKNNIEFDKLSDNIKNLLLEYFNIYDNESFNDKISDVLKWID